MKAKKNKKYVLTKGNPSIELDHYLEDPYFQKKLAEANAFITRVGLPKELEHRLPR
jgi:hypothetical protein